MLSQCKQAKVLDVGCGTSNLAEAVAKLDNIQHVTCIDFSEVLISTKKNTERVSYVQMDARKLGFEDNSFDMLLDKSSLDSLVCSSVDNAHSYLR